MRKAQKEQCAYTLKLLSEAHDEIGTYINKGMVREAAGLLEDCQQAAIGLGTAIEDSEGEGTEAVKRLEEYCELVFRLHEDLGGMDVTDVRGMIKRLQKILSRTENEIRNGIPTTKEIVFLPYKASMWDSLESVWRKYSEDENTTALVIPIPYFDKDKDGQLAAGHYEIDSFPSDVPVTDYREYDFAARHPDSIYIHNPYDESNYATSVDPAFYSKNLKQYTDDLVYIPYFVLGDIDPDNRAAVDSIDYLITLPGVINADRVIVQSENMKKIYVDVLSRFYGEELRAYWKEKIFGTGSPKLERIANLKPEDFEIPDEWRSYIENEGKKKKVILYNTSVEAMLKGGENMIDKIRKNLVIFRENSEMVTLLWRPHPLMEATLDSMMPELAAPYRSIVDNYKNGRWGIYDDTANLDRAIAISDAYYGDMSSLVWLYKETGKPIMIQECKVD